MHNKTIDNNFTYHPPQPKQIIVYGELREKARVFAHMIDEFVPDSREKSLALTKLEEVIMWANAGIARNGLKPIPHATKDPQTNFDNCGNCANRKELEKCEHGDKCAVNQPQTSSPTHWKPIPPIEPTNKKRSNKK